MGFVGPHNLCDQRSSPSFAQAKQKKGGKWLACISPASGTPEALGRPRAGVTATPPQTPFTVSYFVPYAETYQCHAALLALIYTSQPRPTIRQSDLRCDKLTSNDLSQPLAFATDCGEQRWLYRLHALSRPATIKRDPAADPPGLREQVPPAGARRAHGRGAVRQEQARGLMRDAALLLRRTKSVRQCGGSVQARGCGGGQAGQGLLITALAAVRRARSGLPPPSPSPCPVGRLSFVSEAVAGAHSNTCM